MVWTRSLYRRFCNFHFLGVGGGRFFVEFFAVFSNLIGKPNLGKGKGYKSEIRYQGSQPHGPGPFLDDFAIFTFFGGGGASKFQIP